MNPDELIPLTGVSPRAALAAARAVLAGRPGPREASIAHQAAAIVLRDFGDVGAAIREFRLAARLARAAADPDREADVLTSLGTALVMAGRTQAGLAALDDALATVISGTELGRILVRRGGSLHIAGRYEQAQADLRRAITLTRQAGDTLWQARALTAAALAHLAVGAVDRAEAGLAAAEPPCATSPPGWRRRQIPASIPLPCCTASGCGWKTPSAPGPCGLPQVSRDVRWPLTPTPCYPRWARPGWSSSSRSTATCTCWCAGTAGSAAGRPGPWPTPPGRWTSPGSG
jgi:hypothetical protein